MHEKCIDIFHFYNFWYKAGVSFSFMQDTGVRSNTDVGWQGLVRSLTLIHPTGVLSGWGQDSVKASQGLLHQTQLMDLCALVCRHVGTGMAIPKLFP